MTKTVGNSGLIDTWAATGTQTEPNEAKKNLGWTEGERPAFDFMNFIQSQFGEKINHILANGVPLWNATDTYAADAITARAGVVYVALTSNTNSQPPSVNWRPLVTEATLAVAGLVRLASNAETQTGTATDRAVTPASLTSRTATESRTGIVAEATQAQVNAGTGGSRFVTPAKLIGFLTPTRVAQNFAGVNAGVLGSLAFLAHIGAGSLSFGQTVAGSDLRYAGIQANGFSNNSSIITVDGSGPSGTWRCLGFVPSGGNARASLFLRIA
jgi:hypothetical protein